MVLAAPARGPGLGGSRRLESAVGIGIDLTDAGAPAALVDAAAEAFGPVDVLILNSGGPPPGAPRT